MFRNESETSSASTQKAPIRSTTGPADITAIDLSDEEIKRNYSTDNVWDPYVQKIPPLLPCAGIGKYRMSIAADPDWQVEMVKQKMACVTPQFVNQMAEVKLGGAHDTVWQRLASEQNSRSSSFGSLKSSNSKSSLGYLAESTNISNGTRITRGFVPSLPSSASSSIKDAQSHSRRSSETSVSSPVSDKSSKAPLSRSNRLLPPLTMKSLSTIKEMHNMTDVPYRKVERPCKFDENGDTDNALASDDEDEDAWSDTFDDQSHTRRSSGLSRLFQDQKSMLSIPKPAVEKIQLVRIKPRQEDAAKEKQMRHTNLDRNRTVRAARPQFRRQHSRGLSGGPTKQPAQVSQEDTTGTRNTEITRPVPRKLDIKHVDLEPSNDSDEATEDLWMVCDDTMNSTQHVPKVEFDGQAILEQAPTTKLGLCNKDFKAGNRRQRVRSGTAFRTFAPPPVQEEDDFFK